MGQVGNRVVFLGVSIFFFFYSLGLILIEVK